MKKQGGLGGITPEGAQFGFGFDIYGVRVPTIMVSPYIKPNTIFRSTTDTPYDHTSILKSIVNWVGMTKGGDPRTVMLGKRVANAPGFEGVLQGLTAKEGGKDGRRPWDDPVLGVWPTHETRPRQGDKFCHGDQVHLRYIGNKFRENWKERAMSYLGGPERRPYTMGGFGAGWYYPIFRTRDEAIPLTLTDVAGGSADVLNGSRLMFTWNEGQKI